MSVRPSFLRYPPARFVPGQEWRPQFARHDPRLNRILAALPGDEYRRLLPRLEPVELMPGWVIHGVGEREKYLHFITEGIVTRICVMRTGASAEFAVTGNEGVIGLASFLGGESMSTQAVVLSAGYAYRLPADLLKGELGHAGQLPLLLLRFTQALIAQTGQIAVCNRYHSLDQRLCRWILSSLDRVSSSELAMTQEQIADVLGVRREGVTEAAGKLQEAGLIHYGRGRIAVRDRPRLEARACECYSAIKREYQRLLPGLWRTEARA